MSGRRGNLGEEFMWRLPRFARNDTKEPLNNLDGTIIAISNFSPQEGQRIQIDK